MKKIKVLVTILFCTLTLSACGADPQMVKFKTDVEEFCNNLNKLDNDINDIDSNSDEAVSNLLDYLDKVDQTFGHFAQIDFPEEYDYLEQLSDEAADYMEEAVSYYHQAFSNNQYDSATGEYASENYARAIKRIQFIVDVLNGSSDET